MLLFGGKGDESILVEVPHNRQDLETAFGEKWKCDTSFLYISVDCNIFYLNTYWQCMPDHSVIYLPFYDDERVVKVI